MSEKQWTLDTLQDHLKSIIENNNARYEVMFANAEKSVHAALNSADTAIKKAEAASDKRFEGVNEFRATLADQQRMLMPRAETEEAIKRICERLMKLEDGASERRAKYQGMGAMWGIIIAVLGAVSLVSGFIMMLKK